MNPLVDLIENFIQENKNEILQYFSKCHSYFIDLITSKGVKINSNINKDAKERTKSVLFSMINTSNSGLNTIGLSSQILKAPNEIYEYIYYKNLKNYNTYLDFFNLYLKGYINNYLLIVLIEFISDIDRKKLENLDLFDLIPQGFFKRLQNFKDNNNQFIQGNIDNIKALINQFEVYFDTLSLTFKERDVRFVKEKETLTERDILRKLQLAKEDNLGVLQLQEVFPPKNETKVSFDTTSKSEIYEQKEFFLLDHFENFPKLPYDITSRFHVNFENLNNTVNENYKNFDLEEIFYLISTYKILNRELPLNTNLIEYITKDFINGKIFSTGKYHIPNPISIMYGLALFSQLGIINKSELIDILDIEMNLEKELINFNPKNSYLNFHTLMSLKLLQRSGGIIKKKDNLLKPLLSFDIESVEKFAPYRDLFYHVASIKLIDPSLEINLESEKYYKILKNYYQSTSSINNCLTNIARTFLTLRMLDLAILEDEMFKSQYNYLIDHLFFFNNNINNRFSWKSNNLALKIELRMLFWTLLLFI